MVTAFSVVCAGCGDEFEAKRASAKWCSERCRKAAKRAAEVTDLPELPADLDGRGLVDSVQAELDRTGRTKTFHGQLALQLARRLAAPEESGISSLSKELRLVMAAALDGVEPPASEASGEAEDEVEKARRKREEARQAAGLA